MPVVSVATAGGISYPYLSSGDGTGVSRSNSVLMNLNNPTFNESRSLSDINSGKASSLSVSPIDSSKGLSLEIQSDSPGLDLDPKGEIMQINSLPIKGIQSELDKESKVGELSSEQLREFEEAIKHIEHFKQGFKGIFSKIQKYQKMYLTGDKRLLNRTFKDIRDQFLNSHHRKSLQKFFEAYSNLKAYRNRASSVLEEVLQESEKISIDQDVKIADPSLVKKALKRIGWDEKEINFFSGRVDEENWGWGSWEQNPFSVFFKEEGEWRRKMTRVKDAETIYQLNKSGGFQCSSYHVSDFERSEAIKEWCKLDDTRFVQMIEGYKSEIELDIASWLFDQMKIMQKEREDNR